MSLGLGARYEAKKEKKSRRTANNQLVSFKVFGSSIVFED